MSDKLRTPFSGAPKFPGMKNSPGVYDKTPVEGVDQPGTYDKIAVKTFEDIGPKTAPNSAQSHKLGVVKSPMQSNVAKG